MEVVKEFFLSKIGQVDYVQDGKLHVGTNMPSIMVTSEADLASLPNMYPPGTVAYTAGFKAMWQLGADMTWVSMM